MSHSDTDEYYDPDKYCPHGVRWLTECVLCEREDEAPPTPSAEPVAWMSPASRSMIGKTDDSGCAYHIITTSKRTSNNTVPLYAVPVYGVENGPNGGVTFLTAPPAPSVEPVAPVTWREHVEQRIRSWRQRTMNRSGDHLAIDDFMGESDIDDLVDFVCDEWSGPHPEPSAASVTWGIDWGTRGDRSCCSIVKKHADGTLEVVAVEYDPRPDHRAVMRMALDALLLTPSSGYSMKRDDTIKALRAALGEVDE